MRKIDTATAIATRPTAAAPGTEKWWTKGDPGTSTPATIMDEDFFNDLQANLAEVQDAAGVAHTKGSAGDKDLLTAIQTLIGYATPATRVGQLEKVNASSVRIRPGTAGSVAFLIDGVLVKKDTDLTFDMTSDLVPSEAASTVYYLYVEDDAGVLTPHIDSVAPYLPGETKPGYHSSGGSYAGWLCCGFVINDSSSDLISFVADGQDIRFKHFEAGLHWSLSTTVPLAWTPISLSLLPDGVLSVEFAHDINRDDVAVCFGASDASFPLPTGDASHQISDAALADVSFLNGGLLSNDSDRRTGGCQFRLPIADPGTPAVKYGNIKYNSTNSIDFSDLWITACRFPFLPQP